MNPEPLLTARWMRGLLPRTLREVIFAIGLNQASDTIAASSLLASAVAPLLQLSEHVTAS